MLYNAQITVTAKAGSNCFAVIVTRILDIFFPVARRLQG